MKKFVFNLETLLHHRMNLEEKQRNELSRLRFLLESEVKRRDDLRRRLRATALELSRLQNENVDSGESAWYCLYMDRIRHEIELSDERIVRLEKNLKAQRLAVIEATKKTKVLKALQARRLKEYDLAVERQGQRAIDEIVVTRFARREE